MHLIDRRTFARWTALSGLAALTACRSTSDRPPRPLRILVLGGTVFLGPHTVNAALARGHEVTLFNRGRSNPHLFPELEKLHGDRDGDLDALRGRSFDVVVDTSGYVPRHVRDSAELLAPNVRQYVFISTISVYADGKTRGFDETYPVGKLEDETVEQVTNQTYGPLKALCEEAAESAMPGRVANIRPGLIVGPDDRSDRYTFWPVRIARGGEVLCPGSPRDPIAFIDVRDLGEWIVHVAEQGITGVFNADGPRHAETSMGEFVRAVREAVGPPGTSFTWIDSNTLGEEGVPGWSNWPGWIPPDSDFIGLNTLSNDKAVANGLRFRTLQETARDTLAWFREARGPGARTRTGITPEREAELIRLVHEKYG